MVMSHRRQNNIWKYFIVLSSFVVQFYDYGLFASNGVFMTEFLRYFEEGAFESSWVFTLSVLVTVVAGPVTGYMVCKYGERKTALFGAAVHMVAIATSAFAQNLLHLSITFGIVLGVGQVMLYIPSLSILAKYFKSRYAFVNGFAGLGASVGEMVFPPLMAMSIQFYGWRGTFLLLIGISANMCVCAVIMKPTAKATLGSSSSLDQLNKTGSDNFEDQSTTSTEEHHGVRETNKLTIEENGIVTKVTNLFGVHLLMKYPAVASLTFCVLTYCGSNTSYVIWIVVRAVTLGISRIDAANLMTYLGVSAVIGRLSHGWFVDRGVISPMTLMSVTLLINLVFGITYTFVTTYVFMIVSCIGIGFCQGVMLPLFIVCARSLVRQDELPTAIGLLYAAFGLGSLLLPATGKVYEITQDTRTPFYIIDSCNLLAVIVCAFAVMFQTRKTRHGTPAYENVN
ncbi:monocarboxylate transporter 13-like [Glandiceps talaboti]